MARRSADGGSLRTVHRRPALRVAGRCIAKVALKKRVKPLYAVGLEYKFFVMLSRLLPIRTIGWLLGLLYSGK